MEIEGLEPAALAGLRRADLDRATWKQLFAVYTAPSLDAADGLPSMLGRCELGERTIRFTPRFPFSPGLDYTAHFDGSRFDALAENEPGTGETRDLTLAFRMPDPAPAPPTRVEAVYPSATELPENLLRLYVHFSAPMRARDVHRYVHLFDSAGNEVPLPFVEVRQGLWDPSQRRLTLLFHPGRVKRGVAPNTTMGPPLRDGETFRLVIDREFPDGGGEMLVADFVKEIRTGVADRASPDPSAWRITAPRGARDAVVLKFPRPLDHSLLQRMISVTGPGGDPVAGTVEVTEGETRWSMTPDAAWRPGDYAVVVDPALEDPSGNRLDRLFDEKTTSSSRSRIESGSEAPRPVVVARFTVEEGEKGDIPLLLPNLRVKI